MTQLDRLYTYLHKHAGQWIRMTVLMRACGSNVLHSRIADLRREGVGKIENRMTFIYDGDARIVISEYRFTPQQDCDKRHNLGGKSK